MIKMTRHDDNKEYLCITIKDGMLTADLYHELVWWYPIIASTLKGLDNNQILIEILDGVQYGFSLRDLRDFVSEFCETDICTFTVWNTENGIRRVFIHRVA